MAKTKESVINPGPTDADLVRAADAIHGAGNLKKHAVHGGHVTALNRKNQVVVVTREAIDTRMEEGSFYVAPEGETDEPADDQVGPDESA